MYLIVLWSYLLLISLNQLISYLTAVTELLSSHHLTKNLGNYSPARGTVNSNNKEDRRGDTAQSRVRTLTRDIRTRDLVTMSLRG